MRSIYVNFLLLIHILIILIFVDVDARENSKFQSDEFTNNSISERFQRIPIADLELGYPYDSLDPNVKGHNNSVFCALTAWSHWRGPHSFDLKDIDVNLCTHILYIGPIFNSTTTEIVPSDKHLETDSTGLQWFAKLSQLKEKRNDLKVILSIGGWAFGVQDFQIVASDGNKRQAFIDNAVEFLSRYNFDGINLAWMWPTMEYRGGLPRDKKEFNILLLHFQTALKKVGMSLSVLISGEVPFVGIAYDLNQVSKFVDYMIVHTVGFKGDWNTQTGHHTNLKDVPNHVESVSKTLTFLQTNSVNMTKVVLLISAAGRSFTINNSDTEHGLGANSGRGFISNFTNDPQEIGYNEICFHLLNAPTTSDESSWSVYRDNQAVALFMRNGNKWVSFDAPETIKEKTQFALSLGVNGYGIWTMDQDDFQGIYCSRNSSLKYPLLSSLNSVLKEYYDLNAAEDSTVTIRSGLKKEKKDSKNKRPIITVEITTETVKNSDDTISNRSTRIISNSTLVAISYIICRLLFPVVMLKVKI